MFRLGIVLVLLSLLAWLAIPVVPFLGLSAARSAGVVGGAFVASELLFWSRRHNPLLHVVENARSSLQ